MNSKRVWINAAPSVLTLADFVWRRSEVGPSSFETNLDPYMPEFGKIAASNRDAVWLAVTAFLADRTTPRKKRWVRDIHIAVPVSKPAAWRTTVDCVQETLSFLTSDNWEVDFVGKPRRTAGSKPYKRTKLDLVCLFSGGADSTCGAVKALANNTRVMLVSHWDWASHAHIQTTLVEKLQSLFDVHIPHHRIHLGRGSEQIDNAAFRDEPTRRSRSLLFVTLGLATASVKPVVPLWIPENGFASLNPPMAPERLGSLSTRTTHPRFFAGVRCFLRATGAHSDLSNPFSGMTKGEIFSSTAEIIGKDEASELLSMTHSCSHAQWAGRFGLPPATPCGVCFGCVVRRAAFIASGLEDRTSYLINKLTGAELDKFLNFSTVRADIETLRYAVTRNFGPADVITLNLPDGLQYEKVLDLIRRGFNELKLLELP